ncbi:MAG: DnaA/Hda family protein, partial [Acidobacteriota bacterium]
MDRWQALQPHLRQMMGDEEYQTWIEPLAVLGMTNTTLTLTTDNTIVAEWVRDHLQRDIETVARSHYGPEFRVLMSWDENAATTGEMVNKTIATHPFNPGFTFERFVVGSSNQFAAAAAEAVADRPGETYNPLYLYGGSGLGKTHLLHAVANRLASVKPTLKVTYMTTEQFVNELINCIRRKQMDAFRQTFREVDLLLLDDIQFIAGKEQTQEEFFHTFNTLQSTGRQVVFTSDARPADISGVEERLRSRFLQGLIADIQRGVFEPYNRIRPAQKFKDFRRRRSDGALRASAGREINHTLRHHPVCRTALRCKGRGHQRSLESALYRPPPTGRDVSDSADSRAEFPGDRPNIFQTPHDGHVRCRQRTENAPVKPGLRCDFDLLSRAFHLKILRLHVDHLWTV